MKLFALWNKTLAYLFVLPFALCLSLSVSAQEVMPVSENESIEEEEEEEGYRSEDAIYRPSNGIFLEYWGHSRDYSLNYERTIVRPGNTRLNIRVGVGYTEEFVSSPMAVVLYVPIKQQELWLSAGFTPYVRNLEDETTRDVLTNFVAGVGYRYTFPTTNWFIQASVHPILRFDPTTEYFWGEVQRGQVRPAIGAGLAF